MGILWAHMGVIGCIGLLILWAEDFQEQSTNELTFCLHTWTLTSSWWRASAVSPARPAPVCAPAPRDHAKVRETSWEGREGRRWGRGGRGGGEEGGGKGEGGGREVGERDRGSTHITFSIAWAILISKQDFVCLFLLCLPLFSYWHYT